MGDKRNFAALEWVVGEISETLREARHSLEAYVEDPKDTTRIRFCLTHIHQVQGSLQMVEFHGAALLAEELEHTAQAIMNNSVANVAEAQEVLMRGLLQLPTFLDHIKRQRDDNPAVVLPLLNDMRAVRKESYLSETNLFSPDLSSVGSVTGKRHAITEDAAQFAQLLKKLREMYQFAAASVLRGIKMEENLEYIDKVVARLEIVTRGTACHPTWEVSAALVEGLKSDAIELTVAVRGLLRYIARDLRILAEKAPASLDVKPKESLLKNLLYYVARAEDGGKRIEQVNKKYGLDGALISTSGGSVGKGDVLQTPDNDAIRSVVVALQEELSNVKHILDLSLSGQGAVDDLKEILPTVKRIADTMAILGIGDLRKKMIAQNEALEELSRANSIDENELMQVASNIIEIEQRLHAIGRSVGKRDDLSTVNEREVEIDTAKSTVINECCAGLEKVKEAITEYMASNWDNSHLSEVGELMTHIRGGLNMIPLRRSAEVVRACGQFMQEQLIDAQIEPDSNILFNLSDAIVSIEYYLERLTQNIEDDAENYLDMAEESVKALGYQVATSAEPSAPANDAAEQPSAEPESSETNVEQVPVAEEPTEVEDLAPAAELEQSTTEPEPVKAPAFEPAPREPETAEEAESPAAPELVAEAPVAEAEPEAAAAPMSLEDALANAEDLEENEDSEVDEEIIEIFIEEAGEVLDTLNEFFPLWRENEADNDSLVVVRRAFHTLKGSGRMVEAFDIGELAWSVENMLNRVIDKTIPVKPQVFNVIDAVIEVVPTLVKAFELRKKNPIPQLTDQYAEWAQQISEGNFPAELEDGVPALSLGAPAAAQAPVVDAASTPEVAETASSEPEQAPEEEISLPEPTAEATDAEDEPEHISFPEVAEEEDEDEDAVLREIFSSEAMVHLHTIDLFVKEMEEEAPFYSVPTDPFQRALHTLKGSAKMAQVWPIAEITEPLENFAKELISFQIAIDEDILQLIRDAVTYTREGLQQIRKKQPVVIEKVPQFVARTQELRHLAVGHLILNREAANEGQSKADPRMLSLVMAEEMALLLNVESLLEDWEKTGEPSDDVAKLVHELQTLEEGARLANLPPMEGLSSKLRKLHECGLNKTLGTDATFFALLKDGHDALLDMVDAVAAGQNVVSPPAELIQRLDALLFSVQPQESEADLGGESAEEISFDADGGAEEEISFDEASIEDAVYDSLSSDEVSFEETADEGAIEFEGLTQDGDLEDGDAVSLLGGDALDGQDKAPEAAINEIIPPDAFSEENRVEESYDFSVLDKPVGEPSNEFGEFDLNEGGDTENELTFDLSDADNIDAEADAGEAALGETAIENEFAALDEAPADDDAFALDEETFSFDEEPGFSREVEPEDKDAFSLEDEAESGQTDEISFDAGSDEDSQETSVDASLATSVESPELEELSSLADVESDETEIRFDNETMSAVEGEGDTASAFEQSPDTSIEAESDETPEIENEDISGAEDFALTLDDSEEISFDNLEGLTEEETANEGLADAIETAESFEAADETINLPDVELSDIDADTSFAIEGLDSDESGDDFSQFMLDDDTNTAPLTDTEDGISAEIDASDVADDASFSVESLDDDDLTEGFPDDDELSFDQLPESSDSDSAFVAETHTSVDDELDEVDFTAAQPEQPAQESQQEAVASSADEPAAPMLNLQEGQIAIPGLIDVIDPTDEDFDADILEVFLDEAQELVEELDEAIHTWEGDWGDTESVEAVKRVLHTLKGGARLSGLNNLGELTHDYESYMITKRADEINEEFFKQIHQYQDGVLSAVRGVKTFMDGDTSLIAIPAENIASERSAAPEESQDPATEIENVDAADVAPVDVAPVETAPTAEESNVVKFAPKPKPQPSGGGDDGDFVMPAITGTGGAAQAQVAQALKKAGPQEMIKVSAELLEELVNLAGETSISRARLEQQISDFGFALDEIDATLHRLQEQLRRLDIETEAQVLFRQEQMEQHEDFDPLEMDRYSHMQQLSRSLIESASDLVDLKSDLVDKIRDTETILIQQQRINTNLQEGLMRSRMVPFSRLVPRLRRIVRQVATELGKNVSFELDNIEGELDRSVLERMVPPFEHMLRNAVDHGIESPEDRAAAGKAETGRIVLTLGREGGDVIIRLADDGRGVNLKRVREKAIERELMSADSDLSDHDIMQFILHAGFSTAESVTQISGRGVGMDVVHAEIKQLGGSVTINSTWGKGTEFVVRLPFTLSVNRALMVDISGDSYAVPLSSIEGIVRVSPFELEHYYSNTEANFEYANEVYQVRYLGSLLNTGSAPKLEGQALPLPVILVRSAEHTMALQVDALMGSREIVVKSLGQQFSLVQGLSGATVMGDGSVVVILDPHALVRQEIARANLALETGFEEQQHEEVQDDRVKTVMVVDDSVTVRKVTTRFLEREGFNVITAKDGVDALRVLQEEIPDLMLLDIEMPRMDGFEVARTIRTTQRWEHLPIIMITSRTGDKHREHALSLGVDKYLGKPYQEDLLLESIAELLERAKALS